MEIVRPCRFHLDLMAHSRSIDFVLKHAVGSRATTDVAHAHEEDRIGFHRIEDYCTRRRWLLRVRSKKSSGLVLTQATNRAMPGSANKVSTELNCLANSVSVKSA